MKNTFKTQRIKVRGFFPYVVRMPDRTEKYLFEVSGKTTLRDIIKIEERFEDHQIIFATVDPNFSKQTSTIDAANLYGCGNRKRRHLYYYKDGKFYITVKVRKKSVYPDSVTLAATDTVIDITCDDLPF